MKVEIRVRADKERGLFATEYIKKGEVVCILPIDYFQLDNRWYVMDEKYIHNKIDFRYGILCEIDRNGGNEYDAFHSMINDKKHCMLKLLSKMEIIGVSNRDVTIGDFIGHIINDYVDMSFLNENNYKKMSKEFSNVRVSAKLQIFKKDKRVGLRIIAIKDIEKGKELYMSYGSDYWKKYSGKDKFVYDIKLSVIR
jgi:hypothetical protein